MKIRSTHLRFSLQLGLCLAACLPLHGYAEIRLPHWLNPIWIQEKLMDFHTRNTERMELAQALTKKNGTGSSSDKDSGSISSAASGNSVTAPAIKNDKAERTPGLAPVEVAVPKMNEKYLSKEELRELRKQLRQQN